MVEQAGARCCFIVPNCFLKTHVMRPDPEAEGVWKGKKAWKPVAITKVSDDELHHLTTDGLFIMKRLQY